MATHNQLLLCFHKALNTEEALSKQALFDTLHTTTVIVCKEQAMCYMDYRVFPYIVEESFSRALILKLEHLYLEHCQQD
jgi:hypothetical protein